MEVWLYVEDGCGACAIARSLAASRWGAGNVREVVVDDPLLQLGVQTLFSGLVVTPVVLVPGEAIYKLSGDGESLIEHVSLRAEGAA